MQFKLRLRCEAVLGGSLVKQQNPAQPHCQPQNM